MFEFLNFYEMTKSIDLPNIISNINANSYMFSVLKLNSTLLNNGYPS